MHLSIFEMPIGTVNEEKKIYCTVAIILSLIIDGAVGRESDENCYFSLIYGHDTQEELVATLILHSTEARI